LKQLGKIGWTNLAQNRCTGRLLETQQLSFGREKMQWYLWVALWLLTCTDVLRSTGFYVQEAKQISISANVKIHIFPNNWHFWLPYTLTTFTIYSWRRYASAL